MPEASNLSSDQRKLLDDLCPLHETPMVRTPQHAGDGKVEYADPKCPLCEDLKSRGGDVFEKTKAAIEKDQAARKSKTEQLAAQLKEQQTAPAVKPTGDAPAAKT